MKALAKAGRLRGFRQDRTRRHNRCAEIKANESTIKAAAASPVLESLSLTLGSKVKQGLEVLDGNTSLKTLAIFMEGFTALELPAKLPELKVLRLKVTQFSAFNWRGHRFVHLDYPKLEEIVFEDSTKPNQFGGMCMEFLHFLVDQWPDATIKLTSTFLLDIGKAGHCAKEAFARHGLPRAAGEVTEENPLVLPPPTDGTRGPCCWFALYECFEENKYGYE